jgi:hypothetical protein
MRRPIVQNGVAVPQRLLRELRGLGVKSRAEATGGTAESFASARRLFNGAEDMQPAAPEVLHLLI